MVKSLKQFSTNDILNQDIRDSYNKFGTANLIILVVMIQLLEWVLVQVMEMKNLRYLVVQQAKVL